VHEGIKAGPCLCRDQTAEGRKIVGARIPRRNAGGRALMWDQFVGRNSDGGAVGIDMGVEVYEAGRD
jgi:hypothetical protein